ncbi:MAG: envelope stress response membrane protein PspB [Desulfuromusa sp.]|nr:envelope stress response membrane protein PspB [Desulfuromusa sp.]
MSTTLFGMLTAVIIVFMVVVLPIWLLLHYLAKMKKMQGLSKKDEATLSELWQNGSQLQQRIATLETILDEKNPDWRDKS